MPPCYMAIRKGQKIRAVYVHELFDFFAEDDKESCINSLVEGGILPELAKLLSSGKSPEKTAQLVAELAKIGNALYVTSSPCLSIKIIIFHVSYFSYTTTTQLPFKIEHDISTFQSRINIDQPLIKGGVYI